MEAAKELPEIPFVFAGSGPLEGELEKIPNVTNVGFQTGEALELLIRQARLTVLPSECYENCPFTVLESISYGTPVLGADIGGIPELIEVGRTGELFESGNLEELKTRLVQQYFDSGKYFLHEKNTEMMSVERYTDYLMELI